MTSIKRNKITHDEALEFAAAIFGETLNQDYPFNIALEFLEVFGKGEDVILKKGLELFKGMVGDLVDEMRYGVPTLTQVREAIQATALILGKSRYFEGGCPQLRITYDCKTEKPGVSIYMGDSGHYVIEVDDTEVHRLGYSKQAAAHILGYLLVFATENDSVLNSLIKCNQETE